MNPFRIILIFLLFFMTQNLLAGEREWHTVTKVIDGETLEIDGKETIRLIGVATPGNDPSDPRKQKWYDKAKEFTQKLVEGRQVWINYGKVKTDEQGRTWAFVYFNMPLKKFSSIVDEAYLPFWTKTGDFMLNRVLVEFGYAVTKSPFSFKYRSVFMQLEKRARDRGYGMWIDYKG